MTTHDPGESSRTPEKSTSGGVALEVVNPLQLAKPGWVLAVEHPRHGPGADPAKKLERPGLLVLAGAPGGVARSSPLELRRPEVLRRAVACDALKLELIADPIWELGVIDSGAFRWKPEDKEVSGEPGPHLVLGGPETQSVGSCVAVRLPAGPEVVALQVQALGIPGYLPWRYQGPPPPQPPEFPSDYYFEPTGAQGKPVFATPGPREAWIRLSHPGSGVAVEHDVALVTVAPFVFSCELDRAARLYFVYLPDIVYEKPTPSRQPGNFGLAMDLVRLAGANGIDVKLWPSAEETPDRWAQDATLVGYGVVPGAACPYIAEARRCVPERRHERPYHPPGGPEGHSFGEVLSRGVTDKYSRSQSYGGNIVASPPIAGATAEIEAGDAGAKIDAHPPAPYGKIVFACQTVGQWDRKRPDDDFAGFLRSQTVQPLVPIDVSQLKVCHADEVVSFVPAASSKGWAMLFASPALARDLVVRLTKLPKWQEQVRRFQRIGARAVGMTRPQDYELMFGFAELSFFDVTFGLDDKFAPVEGTKAFDARLAAVRLRLKKALDLAEEDVIDVPVPFPGGDADLESMLPNMVNLLAFDGRLVIPKPWGPRVSVEAAHAILEGVIGKRASKIPVDVLREEAFWLAPGQTPEVLVADWREGAYDLVESEPEAVPDVLAEAIQASPGPKPEGWRRVRVTWKDSVCLFEAYMHAMLGERNQLVFLDDWDGYHVALGEIHCGTKVARLIPDVPADRAWWKSYQALLDVKNHW